MRVSRRAFLVAGAVAGLVGCRDRSSRRRQDPDAAALAAARDTEMRLVAAYDGPQRAQHLAHLTALRGMMPTAPPSSVADPASLVHASVRSLQSAAIGAHAGH